MTAQLGTIGRLAEELREAAAAVSKDLHPTADFQSYDYCGQARPVERMNQAIANLVEFQESWVP